MMTRFYKDRLYHFKGVCWRGSAIIPHEENYEQITFGAFVGTRCRKRDCLGEWQPDDRIYRIEDGHLPDYQPRVAAVMLMAEMQRLGAHTAIPL